MSGETGTAPTEEAAAEDTAAEEAVPQTTLAEAEGWLNAVRPAAVLGLLKDPDYRLAVTPAFAGFQHTPKSLALPLVRSKLAQTAVKDSKFAEKLRSLAETEAKPVLRPAAPAAPKFPAPPSVKPDPVPALKAELKAERDARRKERDTARQELAEAQAALDAAVKARTHAEAERDDARRLAKKQSERIARLERQAAKSAQTEARLVKALNEDKVSPLPAPRRHSAASGQPEPPSVSRAWPIAVRHLLDRAKFDTALALAEDVLKSDPDNLDALFIAVRASEGRKEPRLAFGLARRLLAALLRRTDYAAASETFLTLLRLAVSPEQAEPDARLFLASFPAADSDAVSAARLMLSRLRGVSPAAHDWLTAYIAVRTSLASILMPPPGALGPDDPLPLALPIGRPVTAGQLVDAVGRGQTALVDTARAALNALEAADAGTYGRVWAALEQAASDDSARLLPLKRTPQGAAVVDGSNVAWFDQQSFVQGHPRLRSVLAIRRTLWTKGFFPVVLYADANLPYFIDDKAALLKMRDRQELTLVDAETTADETLLRVAKQMNAPLITNDKMEDWDPERTVRKVRYTVSLSGEALLLSEL